METDMKKTLLATTAFLLTAAPAFAQSYDPDIGSGNITPYSDNLNRSHPNPDLNVGAAYNAYGSYAQAPGWYYGRRSPHARYHWNDRVFDRF
jgi:hypothetical protein